MISVVLVCYNQKRYIRDAVNSVLQLEGEVLEIVISDDCSTDGTYEIVQEIVKTYCGRHRLIVRRNNKNMGLGQNFQQAVACTSGNWVLAAAGDDISEKNRAERIAEVIKSNDSLRAICSSFYYLDQDGFKRGAPSHEQVLRWQSTQGRCFEDLALNVMSSSPGYGLMGATAAWHRSLFDFFPRFRNDLDIDEGKVLAWRAKMLGGTVFLEDQLVGYRRHNDNLSFASAINRSNNLKTVSVSEYERKSKAWKMRVRDSAKQMLDDINHATLKAIIPHSIAPKVKKSFEYLLRYCEADYRFNDFPILLKVLYVLRFWRIGKRRIGFRRIFH